MSSKGKGALPPPPPPKSGGGGGTSQSDVINSILQILAPSDTRHDFGKDRPQEDEQMAAYEKVLFIPSREFKEEDFCVNSVISEFTMSDKSIHKTENNQYDPYDCAQQNKNDYYKSDFTVKTKTGFDYNVSWGCMKYPQTVDLNVSATRGADGNLTQLEKDKLKTFFDEEVKGSKGVAAGGGGEVKGEDLNKSGIKEKGFFGKLKEKIKKKFSSKKEEGAKGGKGGGEAEDEDEKDDKKEIDAPLFYKLMGLGTTEKIALVIDATSVGLIEILSSGEFPPGTTRPDLKYIFTSEVINDPAKKKHPSTFVDNGKGVRWIPCVSTNPVDFVYCYDYIDNDPSNLYLNKFFINKDMRFELSEMKATPVGKTIEYTTNLTIKKFNEDGTIQFIDAQEDSKSKNDISFLTKIIEMLKNAIRSGDVKEFQYAIAFLKKMSGDWLQVLLTLAIENRMRGLKRYGIPGGENFAKDIDRVFFVTHDRIAKAFALTLGCECLFTQAYKPPGKKNSIHSVYLYKKQNEAEVERKTIERANENERAKKGEIDASIKKLTTDLTDYIEKYETEIHGPEMALENAINSHLANIQRITELESKSTKVNDINKFVSDVFSSALSLSMTKKTLPDLRGIVMSELTDDFTILNAIRFPVSTYAEAKDFFKKVGSLETRIKNIGNIIGQSDKLFKTTEVGTSTKVNITEVKKRILEFKKTTVYQSAVNWNWDSTTVTSRILSGLNFNSVGPIQEFNSDRHIFLYNIGDIDDKYKQQITRLFFNIYDFINANTDINVYKQDSDAVVSQRDFAKFTTMTNTLCYEIFYFLGGFGDGVGNNSMQISDLCDAIKTKFENPRTPTITTISESTLHTEITTVNLDSGINKSFTEVSNATTEEITGIESAKVAEAAAGGGGSAAATGAEITITPLGKSNAYLSASSDAVVYKLLTASLFAESSPVERTEFPNVPNPDGRSMSFFKPSHSRQSSRQPIKQYWGLYTQKIINFFGGLPEFKAEYDKGRKKNPNIDIQMENLIKKKPTEITKEAVQNIFKGVKGGSPIPRKRINMKGGGDPTNLFDCYLPIYILLIEFRNAMRNEDYEESSDFELILQFYEFLLTMKLTMEETKTEEERCAIALGIRDFFFINNVVSENLRIKKVPSVLQNLPSSMLSFTGILTTGFCGVLNEDYFTNVENRERSINNEVFVKFIENVNIPGCFNKSYEYAIGRIVYSELVADVSILIEEVGGKFVKAVEQKVSSVEEIKVVDLVEEKNKGQTTDASSGASSSSSVKNAVLELKANTGVATSAGGKKTCRRKRTRRPKKQNNKKTRKRRR